MKPVNDIYDRIEYKLTQKLGMQGYHLTNTEYQEEAFGSRYTIWKNEERQFAVRLLWDGKESWFIVEESPYGKGQEPISWGDLVIVPFDKNIQNEKYNKEIVDAVVDEIR